ncbi:uncharacterized protein GBIM_01393 [Gryllus bimaculatus]|nr:uncharacterized protein GBIM_01393 [Gryllus bimaculatus]
MPCSAVTLSLATITAIVAVALLAIAFSTDNWLYIEVKRAQIHQQATKRGDQESIVENMNSKYYYYTRTKGLFRICYPKERPPTGLLSAGGMGLWHGVEYYEKEKVVVYPQKQQYAYATGYPAPGAYPGPYYHGSQYGPYNY